MSGPVTVTAETLRDWPLPRPDSEKHRRGVALVVAGSTSTPGAALLAGEAALRVGCGKLKVATVSPVSAQLGVAIPESRVYGFDHGEAGDLATGGAADIAGIARAADATLVGTGFVDPDAAEAFCHELVPQLRGPLVLDALASAYVGRRRADLDLSTQPCVLTFNRSELAHVLETEEEKVEREPETAVSKLVAEVGAVVVLGAEVKVIGTPEGVTYVVPAGPPGLAVSGSGDVQAGLVTGLLARGATPAQAGVWGAWLHRTAGDRLAERVGRLGLLAREVAVEVPALLDDLEAGR